jgi:hypothetical protein
MKMTFVVSDSAGRMHLIQHDTTRIPREFRGAPRKGMRGKPRRVNVEDEWKLYQESRPDVIKRFTPESNPLAVPSLVGALDGAVVWYDEPTEEQMISEEMEGKIERRLRWRERRADRTIDH